MHISFSKLKYKFYCKILAALFYKFWFSFSSRNCPRFSIWHDGITRCLDGPCQKLLLWCRFRPQLNVGPYSRRNVDTIISLIYLEEMVLILWPTNINVADHDKIHWLWGWWWYAFIVSFARTTSFVAEVPAAVLCFIAFLSIFLCGNKKIEWFQVRLVPHLGHMHCTRI